MAVGGQLEAHPACAVALEGLDIAGTQRGGDGAGIQLGRQFQAEFGEQGFLVQTVDLLGGGHAFGRQQGQAGEKGNQGQFHAVKRLDITAADGGWRRPDVTPAKGDWNVPGSSGRASG
ncbi:hypothetical protein D3C86_1776480 [compost metagenome]